ncbi:MAG: DUF4199 family protein [Bacteroidota bacterium]|nr:DUF4199 family protein [Bacteroidota bacterium]
MNDFSFDFPAKPNKFVPVSVAALAMTATAVVPLLNFVNCLCCAGIMGGAVLGVWVYKKNFPPGTPFSVGDGMVVGSLGGLFGGALTAFVEALTMGLFSAEFPERSREMIEQVLQKMEETGQSATELEQVRTFMENFIGSPGILFLVILIASVVLFTVFGFLGGVIGGNMFKTHVLDMGIDGTGKPQGPIS